MKLVGLVGSTAPYSTNRQLLHNIASIFWDKFELEILEIVDVPLFNQSKDQTNHPAIQYIAHKISKADGVIIATPEHNHTISAALKSTLEWLSFNIHPLDGKPVMIMGASYYQQGSSRAQLHLRQILDAPGVNAMVLPGNEFLLSNATKAFDSEGRLKDAGTVAFLGKCLDQFIRFIQIMKGMAVEDESEAPIQVVQTQVTELVDTASGASESFVAGVVENSHSSETALTPFEQALDNIFGPSLSIEGKDILDAVQLV